ncbi:MAG: hypothetical protein II822_09910 [Prevotella sp.]|nr:hypothetical protein [Prevotella sp.]
MVCGNRQTIVGLGIAGRRDGFFDGLAAWETRQRKAGCQRTEKRRNRLSDLWHFGKNNSIDRKMMIEIIFFAKRLAKNLKKVYICSVKNLKKV